jgi:protein-tyrosine-phosphatase
VKPALFVCTPNAGRSPVAEAVVDRAAPAAESAGREPGGRIWPEVVAVIRRKARECLASGACAAVA